MFEKFRGLRIEMRKVMCNEIVLWEISLLCHLLLLEIRTVGDANVTLSLGFRKIFLTMSL